MSPEELKNREFEKEIEFSAVRSSGAGGQNVNKVNTKVELRFTVSNSIVLSPTEKELILNKLSNRINNRGELIITSQSERTQIRNKEKTLENFYILLAKALTVRKKRKPTKPSAASVEKRLKVKKSRSENKALRNKPEL